MHHFLFLVSSMHPLSILSNYIMQFLEEPKNNSSNIYLYLVLQFWFYASHPHKWGKKLSYPVSIFPHETGSAWSSELKEKGMDNFVLRMCDNYSSDFQSFLCINYYQHGKKLLFIVLCNFCLYLFLSFLFFWFFPTNHNAREIGSWDIVVLFGSYFFFFCFSFIWNC